MAKSPLHYQDAIQHPLEDTDAMRIGRAVHCAVLEPARFSASYPVWGGARRAGSEWVAFLAACDGDYLREEEAETVRAMSGAVRGHTEAAKLLLTGESETVLEWTDPDTDIECKGRVDWLRPGVVADLKTTRDGDKRTFERQSASMHYFSQLGFYSMGAEAMFGRPHKAAIISVENVRPYDVAVYRVPALVLDRGKALCRTWLRRLAECRATGLWPGRYSEVLDYELPAWMMGQDEIELEGGEDVGF
jgi:hypothetical protein